jgi:Flp pilus assembly protein TadG
VSTRPLVRVLRRDESGSVALEMVLLTPLLVLMLLFVVTLGRVVSARIEVDGAAAQATRAASIARDPATATAMATQAAATALGSDHVTCADVAVSTDTADFVPGGEVQVTVTCHVNVAALVGLDLPVSEALSSTAASVIDTYRAST